MERRKDVKTERWRKGGKMERQKDRKMEERRKDGKTKRQKVGKAERWKDGKTKRRKDKKTEILLERQNNFSDFSSDLGYGIIAKIFEIESLKPVIRKLFKFTCSYLNSFVQLYLL